MRLKSIQLSLIIATAAIHWSLFSVTTTSATSMHFQSVITKLRDDITYNSRIASAISEEYGISKMRSVMPINKSSIDHISYLYGINLTRDKRSNVINGTFQSVHSPTINTISLIYSINKVNDMIKYKCKHSCNLQYFFTPDYSTIYLPKFTPITTYKLKEKPNLNLAYGGMIKSKQYLSYLLSKKDAFSNIYADALSGDLMVSVNNLIIDKNVRTGGSDIVGGYFMDFDLNRLFAPENRPDFARISIFDHQNNVDSVLHLSYTNELPTFIKKFYFSISNRYSVLLEQNMLTALFSMESINYWLSFFTSMFLIILLSYMFHYKVHSEKDHLTGLFTRKIIKLIDKKVSNGLWSLIIIDCNKFKYINDTFGHAEGDNVLRYLGRGINLLISRNEFGIRLGGDEFMVFIKTQADSKIIDFMKSIDTYLQNYKGVTDCSVSMGYSKVLGGTMDELATAMNIADHAMYDHKHGYYNSN